MDSKVCRTRHAPRCVDLATSAGGRLRKVLSQALQRLSGMFARSPRGIDALPPLYVVPGMPPGGRHLIIGSWKVLGVVGEGTSATVLRVVPKWALEPAVHYALKLHHHSLASNRHARDRFKCEARLLRSLRHRNIVELVDTGEYQGRLYLVMEMVEGRNLREANERWHPQLCGKLDWSIQIARALEAMHRQGVVHRDLKPENILVTRSGIVKLADFGLARTGEMASVTKAGCLVGTPAYMAPEYILGQEPDCRSDLYCLGVVLYELFTGNLPYEAVTMGEFLDAHLGASPIPPRKRVAWLPPELESIILRLLEKKPLRRFPSAEALRLALQEVLAVSTGITAPLLPRRLA